MDYKRRNILLVCLLTFISILSLISSADVSFKKYLSDPSLADHRCGPTETAFEVGNVFEDVQCGRLCYLDNTCRSVFYQPDSYKCIGCSVNFKFKNCSDEIYPGSKYYRSEPAYILDTDCRDISENRCSAPSGLYEISLWKTKEILTVYCDMETDGGGWTVFQNRFDGSVNFVQNFSKYDNGFGNVDGEFWLGLKYTQELASQGSTEIRLDMTRFNGEKYYQQYNDFKLLDGTDYKLSFEEGPADGTPGLGEVYEDFNDHNGMRFSTKDRALDGMPLGNSCAISHYGGWWYNNCGSVFLNGIYCGPDAERDRCFIFMGIGNLESLQASRMSIRRV